MKLVASVYGELALLCFTSHTFDNILCESQVIEHKPYNHKADVFSYAIVLWELLTGDVRVCFSESFMLNEDTNFVCV